MGTSGPFFMAPLHPSPHQHQCSWAQGLTSKAQAPDNVEEKDGSEDTIERDVGDEETSIVADGPGQVLPRETIRGGTAPPSLALCPDHRCARNTSHAPLGKGVPSWPRRSWAPGPRSSRCLLTQGLCDGLCF